MHDIAITGLGVISSLGHDVSTFYRNLDAGTAAVGPTPWNDEPGLEDAWLSAVQGFDPEEWMEPRVAAGTDLFAQYAIAAAVQAVESSGLDPQGDERTGVVVGTSCAGVDSITSSQKGFDEHGVDGIDRKLQIKTWPNMAAGQIALRYELHGPLLTVTTACASSIDALGHAARLIEAGDCDVALAGGTDAAWSQVVLIAAGLYGMFQPQPDPSKACRPFHTERFGIMGGEGAGMLMLERGDRARERGATIHGYVRGYASLSDGFHPSSSHPDGRWESRTMEKALKSGDTAPEEVDAVIAHGTGTPKGDIAEIHALNRVFGREPERPLQVTSIKGHVGHTAGAAGVMGVLAALRSFEQQALVPTAGTTEVDPAATFEVPLGAPKPLCPDHILVNGFGFGGQNASMLVSRA